MNRRNFLSDVAKLSAAGIIGVSAPGELDGFEKPVPRPVGDVEPVEIVPDFRVVQDGTSQIMVSNDLGRTWQPALILGPEMVLLEVWRDDVQALARIDIKGSEFLLSSGDGWHWLN